MFCSQTFAPSQSLNAKMKHDRTKKAVLKSIRSVHVRRQLLVRRRTIFTLPRSSFLQFPTRETTNAAEADPLFSWKPYPQQLVNPTDKNKKHPALPIRRKSFIIKNIDLFCYPSKARPHLSSLVLGSWTIRIWIMPTEEDAIGRPKEQSLMEYNSISSLDTLAATSSPTTTTTLRARHIDKACFDPLARPLAGSHPH